MKVINSKPKSKIKNIMLAVGFQCSIFSFYNGILKVGKTIKHKVPKNIDCVVSGWVVEKGKIIAKRTMDFIAGNARLRFIGKTIS